MIAAPMKQINTTHPLQVIITQTSIRAKKRIINELIQSLPCAEIQQTYRNKIAQLKTSNQLDQLAADLINLNIN